MSEADPQQEPSMEEILASIRWIISEDDKPEAAAEESDDVLELTEIADDEPAEEAAEPAEPVEATEKPDEAEPVEQEPEQASIDDILSEGDADDELELREDSEADAPAAMPEPVAAPPPAPPEMGLLEEETAASAVGSLSSLVAAVDRAHAGTTLGDGNRTIEDLLKEVMRPMVKEWLDTNLPSLTERLVRREIERLARHADDD